MVNHGIGGIVDSYRTRRGEKPQKSNSRGPTRLTRKPDCGPDEFIITRLT